MGGGMISQTSPIILAKAKKNASELEGMRQAHLRYVFVLSFLISIFIYTLSTPNSQVSLYICISDIAPALLQPVTSQSSLLENHLILFMNLSFICYIHV